MPRKEAKMTLITIAPGIRVLRRHPDHDVLIVEGLGEYATLFIESIPGGWCVVNGEAATKRVYEQVRQCDEGGMDEEFKGRSTMKRADKAFQEKA